MSTAKTVREINDALAMQVNAEARSQPQSPYSNKWVGIANGQVVVVADSSHEMLDRLRRLEPDASKTFGVEASRDYNELHEIWSLR